MIRFLVEKKFEADEKNEYFYIDAFDIQQSIFYRFLYEPNLDNTLVEIEIEPLSEKGVSIGNCDFIDGDVDELFNHVKKVAPKKIKDLYKKYEEQIHELDESEKRQAENESGDILLI